MSAARKRWIESIENIRKITCATCRNFAWSDFMHPVRTFGAWHHPSCPTIRAKLGIKGIALLGQPKEPRRPRTLYARAIK